MANFEIFKTNNKSYRALVKAQERIEFITEEYASRIKAIDAVNRIRRNAQYYDSYKLVELGCGSWLFQLYDKSTGLLLGYSQSQIGKKEIELKVNEMRVLVPFAKFISTANSVNAIK